MRFRAFVLVLCACGRVSFDPLGSGDGGPVTGDTLALGDGGAAVPAGLVAWYEMEEDFFKTGQASDSSGNDLHAYCTLCPTLAGGHRTGSLGAHFNGSFMYFYRPATAALDLPTFTIATWVYPERTPSSFEILVGRPFMTGTDNSFTLDLDMMLRAEYFSQSSSTFGTTSLSLMQWKHLAITFDGTTRRVYVGGALEGMGAPGGALAYDSHQMLIGCDSSDEALAYYFQGSLDDVMVFDRALTASEIAVLAAN